MFLVGALLVSSLVAAQSKKTVADYWKTHANKADVLASSVKIDLKNDYISYDFGGALEGSGEFAVWRRKNGTDLIGQTSRGCGPACTTISLNFMEANKTDVTNKVLPRLTAAQEVQIQAFYKKKTGDTYNTSFALKFPRVGTTITLENFVDDLVLGSYKFNGSSFVFEAAK